MELISYAKPEEHFVYELSIFYVLFIPLHGSIQRTWLAMRVEYLLTGLAGFVNLGNKALREISDNWDDAQTGKFRVYFL